MTHGNALAVSGRGGSECAQASGGDRLAAHKARHRAQRECRIGGAVIGFISHAAAGHGQRLLVDIGRGAAIGQRVVGGCTAA